jgi:hypothetical protein
MGECPLAANSICSPSLASSIGEIKSHPSMISKSLSDLVRLRI